MFKKNTLIFLLLSITISCNYKKINEKESISITNKKVKVKTVKAPAQESFISREENENTASFIKHFQEKIYGNKNYSLNHNIIETDKWIKGLSTIIVFINVPKKEDYESYVDVDGYVLYSKDKLNYNKAKIDTYSPAGNQSVIKSVFFVNSDSDNYKELGVICTWKQTLKNTAEGTLYETRFYDNLKVKNGPQLIYMEEISSHFGIEFEGIREGENLMAKFKTAQTVKNELQKLNFVN